MFWLKATHIFLTFFSTILLYLFCFNSTLNILIHSHFFPMLYSQTFCLHWSMVCYFKTFLSLHYYLKKKKILLSFIILRFWRIISNVFLYFYVIIFLEVYDVYVLIMCIFLSWLAVLMHRNCISLFPIKIHLWMSNGLQKIQCRERQWEIKCREHLYFRTHTLPFSLYLIFFVQGSLSPSSLI